MDKKIERMKPIGGHWEEEFGKFDEDGYLVRRSHLSNWKHIRSNHPDGHGTIDYIDQSNKILVANTDTAFVANGVSITNQQHLDNGYANGNFTNQ